MKNGKSLEISGKESKIWQMIHSRFCYSGTDHPLLLRLLDLALERAEKDLSEPPDPFLEKGGENEISSADPKAMAPNHIAPLQLLVKEIKLPALPQVLMELLKVINDPGSSAGDLAQVIELDPALSSHILRLANSAYYGFPFPIDTVARAVALLGTQEISALAFSSSFLKIFKGGHRALLNIERFWKHSVACAMTARALARRSDAAKPDRHFVAGLLHDLGRLVVFGNIPGASQAVFAMSERDQVPLHEAEQILLGFDHARFGGTLLHKWNFPSALVDSVQWHHLPEQNGEYAEPKTAHLADVITNALGIGLESKTRLPPMSKAAWSALGITLDDVVSVVEELDQKLEATFWLLTGMRGKLSSH